MLLGEDFFAYLVLAFGGALCVGNVLALLRPPRRHGETELMRAPILRTVTMAFVGAIAALWALSSLVVS